MALRTGLVFLIAMLSATAAGAVPMFIGTKMQRIP